MEILNNSQNVILLDAREEKEYAVSKIRGARRIGFKKINYDLLENIDKKNKVIIYCSVGYRSGKLASELARKGFDTYNLIGGIFEWFNRKYPVVDSNGKKTEKIHTYDKNWSRWVEWGTKIY